MATRRPRLWERLFQNLPPWPPREVSSLMCHSSGKLVGRRGAPEHAGSTRRWVNWTLAVLTALGIVFLLSKLAWGETVSRRTSTSIAASGAC